mmetsp:Transcript_34444/g.60418  ORF Transcript_34444/g.60418 Transcript_34444/m.60418 type:complete len:261 (+) Transcript_34444:1389-2171(+)
MLGGLAKRSLAYLQGNINMKRVRGVNSAKPSVQAQWREVYDKLMETRRESQAPVDTMGVECTPDRSQGDAVFRFQALVSLILSAQTKDETNAKVMARLQAHGLTVENILITEQSKLVDLIRDAGFHNNKAKSIKKVAEIIHEKYAGLAPETYDEIIALPGVGPKMTLLYLQVCLGKVVGISVDTHVHRIANRLGWTASKTPEQTRVQLEAFIPEQVWGNINWMLVGYGQTVCKPLNPLCHECVVREVCPTGQKALCKRLH